MDLESLAVVLGLKVESASFVFEVLYFLFAGQHRPDGVEQLHLVIEGHLRVLKLFGRLQQTASEVEILVSIGVESCEHSFYLNPQLQIFEDNPDNPLHLGRIGLIQQLPQPLLLLRRVGQHVQNFIQPLHRQSRSALEVVFDDIVHADREVSDTLPLTMIVWVFVMV